MQTINSRLRPWMSLWLAGAIGASSWAQTNRPAPPPGNRYLLVVETSRAMAPRLDGTLQVVADLLNSGMAGQAERRDTIGLWTYNNDLHAGQFPLQDWSPGVRTNVAARVQGFIRAQKFEKKAQFDKVMPGLQQVVRDSEYITVIIISSGDAPLRGTPFDSRINQFYSTWRAQLQKARMPFIAVLRAQKGLLADCSVNATPWHAELPALPAELLAARAARTAPAAKRQVPAALPPLVFTGHKPVVESVTTAGDKPLASAAMASDAAVSVAGPEAKPGPGAAEKIGSSSATPSIQAQTIAVAASAEAPAQTSVSRLQDSRIMSESPGSVAPASARPASFAQATQSVAATNVPSAVSAKGAAGGSGLAGALPGASFLNSSLLGFAVGLLLVLVGFIFWRWRGHARAPLHISVITRSLERERH
jgi:hypothetical protein